MISDVCFANRFGSLKKNLSGKIRNFSVNGFSIELPRYFSKGMEVEFKFSEDNRKLHELLTLEKIEFVRGEVRWGSKR